MIALKQHNFPVDEFHEKIIELMPCYVSIKNKNLESSFNNKNYIQDFGVPLGCSCYQSNLFNCFENENCPVKKAFLDNTIHYCDNTIINRSGDRMQVWICAVPILNDNAPQKPEIVLELMINAAIMKGCQNQLVTLGQSIAYISHAIKNILEGLHGGGEVIDAGITDGNFLLIEQGWKIVKNNVSDISIIAQNILYSSTKKAMKKEKIHPGYIVKKIVDMMKSKAITMGISLREDINPFLPEVELDVFSIKRMLLNITLNGLEACARDKKSGPHIVIVRTNGFNENHFCFEIEDNGIGMDECEQNRIFNEFYTNRGTKGTGLASVVEKVTETHGGRIEVESTPFEGSLFKIILPIK